MSHRNPRQYLDPDEARCAANLPCAEKITCARYLAPMQVTDKKLGDWSLQRSVWAMCAGYIDASRVSAPAPAPKNTKHPPLGSKP